MYGLHNKKKLYGSGEMAIFVCALVYRGKFTREIAMGKETVSAWTAERRNVTKKHYSGRKHLQYYVNIFRNVQGCLVFRFHD